jgi:GH15 family glucan-1,4-alpha-glucosidase
MPVLFQIGMPNDIFLFHEYFHGETGEGLGASHQTGWTALVVRLVRERREKLLESKFS